MNDGQVVMSVDVVRMGSYGFSEATLRFLHQQIGQLLGFAARHFVRFGQQDGAQIVQGARIVRPQPK